MSLTLNKCYHLTLIKYLTNNLLGGIKDIIFKFFQPWYIVIAVLLKMSAQILICLKLEVPHWHIPAKAVLAPYLFLFPALAVDVFIDLIMSSRH